MRTALAVTVTGLLSLTLLVPAAGAAKKLNCGDLAEPALVAIQASGGLTCGKARRYARTHKTTGELPGWRCGDASFPDNQFKAACKRGKQRFSYFYEVGIVLPGEEPPA